jgi:hypothetical protein
MFRWAISALLMLAAAPSVRAGAATAAVAPRDPHFAVAADDPCDAETRVEDFATRTLLVSPTRARFFDPGRRIEEAIDASAGLPPVRAASLVFATNPPLLEVRKRQQGEHGYPHWLFRFANGQWAEMRNDFGESPVVMSTAVGSVVVGWVYDRVHGDPRGVPVGDMTRAWRVTSDGRVSSWRAWPYVMSWQESSTPNIVWAVVAKPRLPGQFLLRLPIDGRARLFPIPGAGACRGDARITDQATLVSVTDGEARVSLDGHGCLPGSASGSYRLLAARGRWVREGPPLPERPSIEGGEVSAGDQTFSVGSGEVVVRGPRGQVRRFPIEGLHPGTHTEAGGFLELTAGGREVWLVTQRSARCLVYRY